MTTNSNDSRMMIMIMIVISLFFGSGLLWCVSGAIDCKQVQYNDRCVTMTSFVDKYAPIGIIVGISTIPMGWVLFSPTDDKSKKENNRSPIS